MKRFLLCAYLLLGCFLVGLADHITGGEIYYTFSGFSGGQYKYSVTVKLFKRCSSEREFLNPSIISVFNARTGARVADFNVQRSKIETLNLSNTNPCITNPPPVCFNVAYYQFDVLLPASADGYIITSHVVYRIDGMNNLVTGYDQVGATYTAFIPGNAAVTNAPENNSAQFTGSDLVIICTGNRFSYSFAASDKDDDELRYSFCDAYVTTGISPRDNSTPPAAPPYYSVPYGNGYSGSAPLGGNVSIDQHTGLITGIAPTNGTYVVTVCVEEIRNGVVIATQRKDFQINIAGCSIAAATLPDEYMVCGNNSDLTVSNISNSPLINTLDWSFIDRDGNVVHNSRGRQTSYAFRDTGLYVIKLVVNQDGICSDSSTAVARVYPGFEPDFNIAGTCINVPVQFEDRSSTVYGVVDKWNWDFGDNSGSGNISGLQRPEHEYAITGSKNVRLIAGNSMGCIDTVFKRVDIIDKPPIELAFRDTLICPPDAFQLNANGDGDFSWTSQATIINANTSSPFINPVATGYYYVELNSDGCINRDSVLVRVVNEVSLSAMPDTVICRGDSMQLFIESNALRYLWSPGEDFANNNTKLPVITPGDNTRYIVMAFISNCSATEEINVVTVAYPSANVGLDTTICYNTPADLHAITDGTNYIWKSGNNIIPENGADISITPLSTTEYIFYSYDDKGCPKPGIDTVRVVVLEDINAFAGNDTTVVVGQPLQLNAVGGVSYSWLGPALSASDIANPVAVFSEVGRENVLRYKVNVFNEAGCVDSAYLNVTVFASGPDVFVPSAFTPNGDGKNDRFEPVSAGAQIELFQVFNRWGQLMYSSGGKFYPKWDGMYQGRQQSSGTYVWALRGIDYMGRRFTKRGTVVLIR